MLTSLSFFTDFTPIWRALTITPSIWWLLGPILALWLILEIYQASHEQERIGYNTALASGLSLSWLAIEAIRSLTLNTNTEQYYFRLIFITAVLLYGFVLVYFAFTNKVSNFSLRYLASPNLVYFLAVLAILWGHNLLTVNKNIILNLIVIYIIIIALFYLIRKIIPDKPSDGGKNEREKLSPHHTGL